MVKSLSLRLLVLILAIFSINDLSFADGAVFNKHLENGLIILVKESPPKDMVSIDVTLKAAPIYEEEYLGSGISHLVEHMVFKGTKTRKPGDIEKEVRSYGGLINASVSSDVTSYQIIVPSGYFSKALSLLKDMLLNATFEKGEMEKEREVVLKEARLNNDDPGKKLVVLLFANAYLRHPYKYPAIGFESLLKALTREDIVRYYNRRYVPNNIVITVVGGINPKDALRDIEKEFNDFRSPDYRPVNKGEREPIQMGKKLNIEEMPVTLSYLALGFHSSGILDKDLFALDTLSMILGRGNNSRLNNVLVKSRRKAHSISASNHTPQDPGLFIISALLDEDNIEPARTLILEEIKYVKDGDISDKELETAKRMVVSDYVLARETIEAQARDLGESQILTGNPDFFRRYVDGIGKVSKFDVRRAASQYLTEDNLTEVRIVPEDDGALTNMTIPRVPIETRFEKKTLSNGLVVLARKDTKIPAVSITAAFSGGLIVEDKKTNGISNFTARMLLKGTKTRNESDIKGAVENMGGEINSFSGFNSFGLNLTVMKDDIDFALGLIKDIVTNSIFAQEEIDKEKMFTYALIKDEDDDIFHKGALALRRNLFDGHPYSLRYIGEEETIHAITFDECEKFYQKYCVPNNMVISISGDIEPQSVYKKIETLFNDMAKKDIQKLSVKVAAIRHKVKTQTIEMDREQSLLLAGFKTVSINDPDRYPLEVLSAIFSGSGGRLFISLRDKLGLAYTLGCEQKLGVDTGFMLFYAATTKANLQESKRIVFDAINSVRENMVSDEELDSAKKELISSHKIFMQTNAANSFQGALDELYSIGYDNMYRYEQEIKKVKKEDIKLAADKYLDPNAYAEVIIHPSS